MLDFYLIFFLFYSQPWWLMPIFTALEGQKQGGQECRGMLGHAASLRVA